MSLKDRFTLIEQSPYEALIDVVAVYERENIKEATAPLKQLLQQVKNTEKQIEDCEKQINAKVEESTKKINDETYTNC